MTAKRTCKPPGQTESQSSNDELPPTPTKQASITVKQNSLRSSVLGRRPSIGPDTFLSPAASGQALLRQDQSCKSSPINIMYKTRLGGNLSAGLATAPRVSFGDCSNSTPPSFTKSCTESQTHMINTPSPLSKKFPKVTVMNSSIADTNQMFELSPVFQPSTSRMKTHAQPRTPADMTFPDPSGLSISPHAKTLNCPVFDSNLANSWARPPETPTSHRDSGQASGMQHQSLTPSNQSFIAHDVDPVLTERFKKAEWYGRGEFSEVYKVYQAAYSVASPSYFATLCSKSPQTPLPDRVWIVKKSKAPNTSSRQRQMKLREAHIMQALGKNDHVVHLVDFWEANHYLYIQTEFCEEGTLEAFLDRTGSKARLDDFRIWKILMELMQVCA